MGLPTIVLLGLARKWNVSLTGNIDIPKLGFILNRPRKWKYWKTSLDEMWQNISDQKSQNEAFKHGNIFCFNSHDWKITNNVVHIAVSSPKMLMKPCFQKEYFCVKFFDQLHLLQNINTILTASLLKFTRLEL